jgi:ubiquinol-cytochrome c reductase cytochrome b subunit
MSGLFSRLGDWFDKRVGHRAYVQKLQAEKVNGGARLGRSFGVVLLFLFLVEVLTGLALAAYYAPTTTDAWASVHYIDTQVSLGWVVRGLHHYTGSAMVVVAIAHLLHTLFMGAYRAPRELNWVLGVLLLQILIVVSHLGYLLPGDLHSYWATEVMLGIAASQPFIGEAAAQLLAGGPRAGNVSFTHFYALHALLVPVLFAFFAWVHLKWRRRLGATSPIGMSPAEAKARATPYFPNQFQKDVLLSVGVFGVLLTVTVLFQGAPLEAPADPSVEYVARPEWYLLPIFKLRHYFTGNAEFIATSVIPGVATLFLMLLPWLHKGLSHVTARAHAGIVMAVVFGLGVTTALGALVKLEDLTNPDTLTLVAASEEKAKMAKTLATQGVPVEGPLYLHRNDELLWGEKVFKENCATCHSDCSQQPYEGVVCLEGYATRTWLTKFMQTPRSPHFYGNTDIDEMDAWEGTFENLKAVVEFLYLQSDKPDVDKTLAEKGAALYVSEGCESCHSLDGKGTGDGPDLKSFASEAWLTEFIRQPDAWKFYGKLNEMDAFPHEKLSIGEVRAVITFLRNQKDEQVKFP